MELAGAGSGVYNMTRQVGAVLGHVVGEAGDGLGQHRILLIEADDFGEHAVTRRFFDPAQVADARLR